jgi:hypothetical protein
MIKSVVEVNTYNNDDAIIIGKINTIMTIDSLKNFKIKKSSSDFFCEKFSIEWY